MRIVSIFLSSLLLGACSVIGYNAGVKEPPYNTLKADDPYELREYPGIVMITAYAEGDFKNAQDKSFRKLFDYISGNNTSNKQIPMTSPVIMEGKGQKIPMTAPVLMKPQPNGWAMSFVLPDNYTLETAPSPLDKTLILEERRNIKFAVLRFTGLFNEDNFKERSQALDEWIQQNDFESTGPALRAGYNPPWTLPPLRRNEILIPVK